MDGNLRVWNKEITQKDIQSIDGTDYSLLCSSLNFPWITVSFRKPEDFFIPGDKELINSLDWLTVGMELLEVQEPHRREQTNEVN